MDSHFSAPQVLPMEDSYLLLPFFFLSCKEKFEIQIFMGHALVLNMLCSPHCGLWTIR